MGLPPEEIVILFGCNANLVAGISGDLGMLTPGIVNWFGDMECQLSSENGTGASVRAVPTRYT